MKLPLPVCYEKKNKIFKFYFIDIEIPPHTLMQKP